MQIRPSFRWALRVIFRALFVALVLVVLCAAYGFYVEPTWLKVTRLSLNRDPVIRIIYFSDLHYKGDEKYLDKVVKTINDLPGDIVCMGGDIAEEKEFYSQAMARLRTINKPVYAIPGNHDYWSWVAFEDLEEGFKATGGGWLCDTNFSVRYGTIELVGRTIRNVPLVSIQSSNTVRRILLIHEPDSQLIAGDKDFDLILSGHNHGGQVCLPLVGPLLTFVDGQDYRSGLFKSAHGPLYVSMGVGTYLLPFRFYCRPEIVLIEL